MRSTEQSVRHLTSYYMLMIRPVSAFTNGKLSLDDTITASAHAASMGGSDIWLEEGETMSADDMIKATVVASANDAAVALAEHLCGSEEVFVEKMNEKASQLGMKDTVFKNCNGLDEDGHITSAYDVAVMSRELMRHEMIFDYTSIWLDNLRDGKTQIVNTNKLLKTYNGITGLKTGTTNDAGCNNVSTIVFDKTGTLTKGVFNVTDILPANGFSKEQVLEYAAEAESFSNHPIAKSILAAYEKEIDQSVISDYKEISGYGISVMAGEKKVFAGNTKLMDTECIEYTTCENAGTKVYLAVDGQYAGCILITDEVKPDSKKAISDLKHIGVEKTVMLTGDDEKIGKSVAEELQLDKYYAQLLPDQKVEKVELLDSKKRPGSKLAFVGDGINACGHAFCFRQRFGAFYLSGSGGISIEPCCLHARSASGKNPETGV